MNDFLSGLKDALDNGEFNSDAAKNINEISELTEKKIETMSINELIQKLDKDKGAPVSREFAEQKNVEFEEAMKKQKEQDAVLAKISRVYDLEEQANIMLLEISELVAERNKHIADLLKYIDSLTELLETGGSDFKDSIDEIKKKYDS